MLRFAALMTVLALAACGSPVPRTDPPAETITQTPTRISERQPDRLNWRGTDVAMYAMSLIDTGYRFGGKNPQAGLDCSGMVSYIYDQAAGIKVKGSAADIAKRGRPIDLESVRPGDLLFFNTRRQSFSHVGIYIGDQRFVHAPNSNGKVRIDKLSDRYYAQRFELAKTYFD